MKKYQVIEEVYDENGENILQSAEKIVEDFKEAASIYECCKEMAKLSKEPRVISWYIITENWKSLVESETVNPSKVIVL